MLEQIISRARRTFKDARQKLSVDSAAEIEKLFNDIEILNDFIVKEVNAVESNSILDERGKKTARRSVFEQAARKLEVIKAKSNYSNLADLPAVKPVEKHVEEEISIVKFFQEKEIRDRLFGMPEAQILSLFGESLFDGSNPLLISAILNAPAGFEPVSNETLKKITRAGTEKIRPEISEDIEALRDVDFMAGEIFSLIKKELDILRRKELPIELTQARGSKGRPFKF